MCDEVTDSRARSGRTPRVAALTASTAAPARTRAAVGLGDHLARTVHPQRAHARVLVDRHARSRSGAAAARAPAGRAARSRRRARTASAGSAARRSARCVAASSSATTCSPSPAATVSSITASWPASVDTIRKPFCLNQASTPSRLAPLADRLHALRRGARGGQRALVAEPLAQRRQVRPQRLAEPAVASARPVAAHVRLEDHDARAVAQLPGGPHPGVAAADDHDVGVDVTGGRRHRLRAAGLLQPVPVGVVVH